MTVFEKCRRIVSEFDRQYPRATYTFETFMASYPNTPGVLESQQGIKAYHALMAANGTGEGAVFPLALMDLYTRRLDKREVEAQEAGLNDDFLTNARDFLNRKVGEQGLAADRATLMQSLSSYEDRGHLDVDLALDRPEPYEVIFQNYLLGDIGGILDSLIGSGVQLNARQVYNLIMAKDDSSTGAYHRTTKDSRDPGIVRSAMAVAFSSKPECLARYPMVAQYRSQRGKMRNTFGDSLPHLLTYYRNCHIVMNELLHELKFVGFYGEMDVAMRVANFCRKAHLRNKVVYAFAFDQKACDQHCSVLHALQVWNKVLTSASRITANDEEQFMRTVASYFYGPVVTWNDDIVVGKWLLRSGIGPTSATEIMLLAFVMCRALARFFSRNREKLFDELPECEYFGIGDDASLLIALPRVMSDGSSSADAAQEIMTDYATVCTEFNMECELTKCLLSTSYMEFCQRYYPLDPAYRSVALNSGDVKPTSSMQKHPDWYYGLDMKKPNAIYMGKYSLVKAINNVVWPEDGKLRFPGVPSVISETLRLCYVLDNAIADPDYKPYVLELAGLSFMPLRVFLTSIACGGVRLRGWRSKVYECDDVWTPQGSLTFACLVQATPMLRSDNDLRMFLQRLKNASSESARYKESYDLLNKLSKDDKTLFGFVARRVLSGDHDEVIDIWSGRGSRSLADALSETWCEGGQPAPVKEELFGYIH